MKTFKEKQMKPQHYDNGKRYDVIDVAKDYGLNFNLGNVLKYICRAGKKGSKIEDLEKALDYLLREIEVTEPEVLTPAPTKKNKVK